MSKINDFFGDPSTEGFIDARGFSGTVQFEKEEIPGASGNLAINLTSVKSSIKHITVTGDLTLTAPTATAGMGGSAIIYLEMSGGPHAVIMNDAFEVVSGVIDTGPGAINVLTVTWSGDGVYEVSIVNR